MKKILLLLMVLLLLGCQNESERYNKDALKLIRLGNYTEALHLLKEALEIDPENDTTWNNISLSYDAIGEYQLALDAAQKAVNLGDENEIEYSNLGNAYFDLGNIEDAKLAYEKSLELEEDYFYALYGLGNYYHEIEEYEEALVYFYNLYDNNPINIDVIRYIAFCNYKLGKTEISIEFLKGELEKINSDELEQLLELLIENNNVDNE